MDALEDFLLTPPPAGRAARPQATGAPERVDPRSQYLGQGGPALLRALSDMLKVYPKVTPENSAEAAAYLKTRHQEILAGWV